MCEVCDAGVVVAQIVEGRASIEESKCKIVARIATGIDDLGTSLD